MLNILQTVDGWLDPNEAALLYNTALNVNGAIVEIGSYRGRSTCVLALAAKESGNQVFAIDPHTPADGQPYSTADHAALLQNVVRLDLAQWVYVSNFPSPDIAKIWKGKIGLVFLDGNHDAVEADFKAWAKHTPQFIAFHDARTLDSVKAVIQKALDSGKWIEDGHADNTVILRRNEP